jgi:hypothetical protein
MRPIAVGLFSFVGRLKKDVRQMNEYIGELGASALGCWARPPAMRALASLALVLAMSPSTTVFAEPAARTEEEAPAAPSESPPQPATELPSTPTAPATLPTPAAVLERPKAAEQENPLEQRLSELAVRVSQLEQQLQKGQDTPSAPRAQAPVGTLEPPSQEGWSFGGYGEALLSTRFYNPDPKKSGSSYRQSDIDLARVAFFVNSRIADWLTFGSEIEFEHGGTGATREVEWDEFGEYEIEVEKGGEVSLEQAYLEVSLPWGFRVRAGHLLVPVGLTTSYHLPTMFSSARRPESEAHLIPLVWHETGAELQFRTRALSIRLQVASGLDSTGFSSQSWIAGGTQSAFETALINDPGIALAADYTGLRGTLIGVSGYTSNTTRNRPKREMDNVEARVFLGDLHLRGQYGPVQVRGLAMLGALTNADQITAANASLSSNLGASRTPVGSAAYAFFVETAIDVLAAARLHSRQRLDLFAHYDAYDTMWKAPKDLGNPLMQRQVLTVGINYFPHPRVVLKAEYLSRWINQDSAWSLRQDEVNALLGLVL